MFHAFWGAVRLSGLGLGGLGWGGEVDFFGTEEGKGGEEGNANAPERDDFMVKRAHTGCFIKRKK